GLLHTVEPGRAFPLWHGAPAFQVVDESLAGDGGDTRGGAAPDGGDKLAGEHEYRRAHGQLPHERTALVERPLQVVVAQRVAPRPAGEVHARWIGPVQADNRPGSIVGRGNPSLSGKSVPDADSSATLLIGHQPHSWRVSLRHRRVPSQWRR